LKPLRELYAVASPQQSKFGYFAEPFTQNRT
jgi:hypothetical protein